MKFTEWNLPNTHDLIFGQPWFTMYSPQIHWRTQKIEVAAHTTFDDVDGPTFQAKIPIGAYEERYQLKGHHHRPYGNTARGTASTGRIQESIPRTTYRGNASDTFGQL